MSDNGRDTDDDLTPTTPPLGHAGNRELLMILGNFVLEAREHSVKLETLYEGLRSIEWPAPKPWAAQMLGEEERHHKADSENIEELRIYVGSSR